MSDWVQELNDRSKNDRAIIVGSEVRQLCGEIARLTAALSEAQRERDALKGEVERLTNELEGLHARFLYWRGVEENDACPTCDGAGSRVYESTAGWRGGIGGQMITRGVCDKCWGSGSKSRPWLSHRQALAAFEAERAAESKLALAERAMEAADAVVTTRGLWVEVARLDAAVAEYRKAVGK